MSAESRQLQKMNVKRLTGLTAAKFKNDELIASAS